MLKSARKSKSICKSQKGIEMDNIEYLLYPKSIAILGASTDTKKMSGRPLRYLIKHGYRGKIYPVNPRPEITEILGLPCFHSLKEIEDPIDQVIIALPAKQVLESLHQCVQANVKSIVIFSSGFAETGKQGGEMQKELAEIARSSNIALCGPNCQGVINLNNNVMSSFTQVLELDELVKGDVGFISQSGALAGSILSLAQKERVGFSNWISVGNEAVLGVADFIKYLATDSATRVIAAYVEGIKDADKWVEACQYARKARKPVVVMKTGRSETGSKAIISHTGSVAGEDFIIHSFLSQNGVIRVNDIDDMFATIMMLSAGKSSGSGRVGIITSSGGAGIILADACSEYDIELAKFSPETEKKLRSKLPTFASVLNPVDVTAQLFQMIFTKEPELFKRCLDDILSDEAVDILIIALTMIIGERGVKIAQDISETFKRTNKPIAVVWLAGEMANEAYKILRKNNVPLYSSGVKCVDAIQKLRHYHSNINNIEPIYKVKITDSNTPARNNKFREADCILQSPYQYLTEQEGRRLLSLYNISVPKGDLAITEKDAINIAEKLGYPVVLKIDSPDILHKTDANCVFLNVQNKKQLRETFRQISNNAKNYNPNAHINGILVEEMINRDNGLELILGMKNDQIFGPVILLGIGGIFVEVFKEVVCGIAPITNQSAKHMVRKLKGYQILEGVRGKPKLSIAELEQALLDLSRLSLDFDNIISEIDINPLIILEEGKGVTAADVLIIKKGELMNN